MSESSSVYDPDVPEGTQARKSGMISRKDFIVFAVVALMVVLLAYPIYQRLLDERNKHVCKTSLGDISQGLLLYAEENTGRFPPTHITSDTIAPELFTKGTEVRVNTWASLIASYVKNKDAFYCPTAHKDEAVVTEGNKGETLYTTYGMFAGMSTSAVDKVPNPMGTVLLTETSNQGARDTYDPLPLMGGDGKARPDGFVVGLDSTNFSAEDQMSQIEKGKYATRLAFYGTANGIFSDTGACRHPAGNHFVFADGHIDTLNPTAAEFHFSSPKNRWPVR